MKKNKGKFTWEGNQASFRLMQCAKCAHKKPEKGCEVLGTVPKVILEGTHRCIYYEVYKPFSKK